MPIATGIDYLILSEVETTITNEPSLYHPAVTFGESKVYWKILVRPTLIVLGEWV
jgi:hypothetical protein